MIKQIGNQNREPVEETEYELIAVDQHIIINEHGARQVDCPNPKEAVLKDRKTNRQELWAENDHYAGYVIEIGGVGFEFVREL